jgi:hypothetical protein
VRHTRKLLILAVLVKPNYAFPAISKVLTTLAIMGSASTLVHSHENRRVR